MKYLKTLGLAVVATAALTAFVGASSASAAVLGGNPAILDVDAVLSINKAASNAACEEEAFWTGEYEFTSPNPLYVETE